MPTTPRFSTRTGDDSTGRVLSLAYVTPTYAAILAVTPNASQTYYQPTVLTGAMTINATLTTSYVGDEQLWILLSNTAAQVVTFGTGYTPNGAITPNISKVATIKFVYTGTSWVEIARTLQP